MAALLGTKSSRTLREATATRSFRRRRNLRSCFQDADSGSELEDSDLVDEEMFCSVMAPPDDAWPTLPEVSSEEPDTREQSLLPLPSGPKGTDVDLETVASLDHCDEHDDSSDEAVATASVPVVDAELPDWRPHEAAATACVALPCSPPPSPQVLPEQPPRAPAPLGPVAATDAGLQAPARILAKYPERVPVICKRAPRSGLPTLSRSKFLVPGNMPCSEFKYIIHQHVVEATGRGMAAENTIYLFIGGTSPKGGSSMAELFEQHRAPDGLLHITYGAENTLGLWALALHR